MSERDQFQTGPSLNCIPLYDMKDLCMVPVFTKFRIIVNIKIYINITAVINIELSCARDGMFLTQDITQSHRHFEWCQVGNERLLIDSQRN